MFPAPSPNTQAFLNNLQSGGVTPSTADFQQSALRAAAQASSTKLPATSAPTSQPEAAPSAMERPNQFAQPTQQSQQAPARQAQDMFGGHDVSTAANDLLSFANQPGTRNGQQPFAISSQAQPASTNGAHMPVQPISHDQGRRNTKGSLNSISVGSVDTADFSDSDNEQKNAGSRARGGTKKGANNTKQSTGSRRKAEETSKGGNKKSKGNNGVARSVTAEEEDSEEEGSTKMENGEGNKKMTDEEKRKNFLERNRYVSFSASSLFLLSCF